MFRKLLIANRGEIAVRIIKACQQLNIQTVAVCSTADRHAGYTQLADEVVCIGPAAASGSYLNAEAILMAAINTHADAIHPGYGFLAENADFAAMCAECGIAWIGPQTEQIKLMGDNDAMYLEQFLTTARHIEVQVLGTGTKLFILGDRDCSLQLHKQKVLEESPASILTETQRRTLYDLSRQLLAGTHYQSLGTIEYLFADGQFYFMEMNTRLQVEHGVTELTTGIDIVAEQIKQAAGVTVDFPEHVGLQPKCTAIEARLTATLPVKQTRIETLSWPADVRVDTDYHQGDRLVTMYDGLIAKLMVTGVNRQQAVRNLQRALAQVTLTGPTTNLTFLQQTVARPAYIHDQYTIHSLARWEASK